MLRDDAELATLELGSLADLRVASKGGMDPNGLGAARLASDVLWSDPVRDAGFQLNTTRNIGMVFGPDITEVCVGGGGRVGGWVEGGRGD